MNEKRAETAAVSAVQYHAKNCIEALELIEFASTNFDAKMGEGLKKLAQYHADHAFNWIKRK